MNAKDLMVGDWVLYDGKPVRVNCVASSSVGLEGIESDTICKDDMIEPIPITREILENNGFKKGKGFGYSETYPTYCSGYHNDVRDFATIEVTFYDEPIGGVKMLVRMETNSSHQDGNNIIHSCDIESVNQLQHALRLCGIDKEIVVDKYTTEDFLKVKFPASTWQFRYGRQMRNEHFGSNETIWKFPEGVEIEDDKKYRVCYTKRDSADSSDSSTYYTVHFIEEW